MYHVDYKNRVIYFMISTPLVYESDVSPLFQVHNLGWEGTDHSHYRYKLPQRVFFMTEGSLKTIITTDFKSCREIKGVFLCDSTAYTQTNKEYCLESLLFRNKTSGCSLMIKGKTDHCRHHIGRRGILISGYSDVLRSSLLKIWK